MPLQTSSTGVSFVMNNLEAAVQSSVAGNTNAVAALPTVTQLAPQSAMQLTGRNPGGLAYHDDTNVVVPNSTNASILLDDIVTNAAYLPYAKNGAFIVICNGTNAVVVPLTNTATNTNSQAGDTVFAKWNQIILRNLSGTDGYNSASMTVTPTTAVLQCGVNGVITLDGGSAHRMGSVNGVAINSSNSTITITPTANSIFGCVISGS